MIWMLNFGSWQVIFITRDFVFELWLIAAIRGICSWRCVWSGSNSATIFQAVRIYCRLRFCFVWAAIGCRRSSIWCQPLMYPSRKFKNRAATYAIILIFLFNPLNAFSSFSGLRSLFSFTRFSCFIVLLLLCANGEVLGESGRWGCGRCAMRAGVRDFGLTSERMIGLEWFKASGAPFMSLGDQHALTSSLMPHDSYIWGLA